MSQFKVNKVMGFIQPVEIKQVVIHVLAQTRYNVTWISGLFTDVGSSEKLLPACQNDPLKATDMSQGGERGPHRSTLTQGRTDSILEVKGQRLRSLNCHGPPGLEPLNTLQHSITRMQ